VLLATNEEEPPMYATVDTPTTAPDLSTYLAVHVAIRTAAHRMVYAAGRVDPADHRRARALHRYWKGYAGEVLHHHTVEDRIFFPALVERVPMTAAIVAQLDAEHHDLDAAMARCETAMSTLVVTGTTDDLVPALQQLAAIMDAHLDLEDEEVLPLFARHFAAEEYEAMHEQAVKSAGIGRQMFFTVPFMVASCTPEQRASLMDGAPLPLHVIYRLSRGSHRRLARRALGAHQLAEVTW
jgi:hemerythrin-like domain-containing protein